MQQRITEMQKDISQKPKPTVSVIKNNFFNNADEDKDAANCLASFQNSMSPQTPSNINEIIVEDKTLAKFYLTSQFQNFPNGCVVENKPTQKMTGPAGKEEYSNIKMKNGDDLLNFCIKLVDLNRSNAKKTPLRVSLSPLTL